MSPCSKRLRVLRPHLPPDPLSRLLFRFPLGIADITTGKVAGNEVVVADGLRLRDTVAILADAHRAAALTINAVVLKVVPKVTGLPFVIAVAGNDTPSSSSYNPTRRPPRRGPR